MAGIDIQVEDTDDAQETLISLGLQRPFYKHGRQRSFSHMDVPLRPFNGGHLSARYSSAPRLQLSIPPSRPPSLQPTVDGDKETPQSDTPQTPISFASPIAGVVDLTKDVTTTSTYAVAQGGLSDIYLGEWSRLDESTGRKEIIQVAIKVLRVMTAQDSDGVRARKKLNREVYVWNRLEHPNVLNLFGTSYHMGGRPAMVMKWYKNGSAADYLTNKNPSADRLQLILDVARGLEYLHTMPNHIVHADLKGNNVLINDDGAAVLSDFGLSEVVEDLGKRPAGLTVSNPSVGPLRWQAPELSDDNTPATRETDVWSYGCTAYELLTSRIPYSHCNRDAQVLRCMQEGKTPPSPTDNDNLLSFDPRVVALLNRCWNFNAAERPNMTQVRIELESICAGQR